MSCFWCNSKNHNGIDCKQRPASLIEAYFLGFSAKNKNYKRGKNGQMICICGKEMYEVEDSIAKKKTGYQWRCSCMPKDVVLMVG